MDLTVQQCADAIQNDPKKKSFKYFTIQFYGECWGGEETVSKTYFREGTTKNCYMGTGGAGVNYVYHFGTKKGMSLTTLNIKGVGSFCNRQLTC